MKRAAKPARRTLADQLRDVIRDRRLSGYELAKGAGLARSVVNRFIAGDTGLTIDSLDALADVLGLRLVEVGRRQSKPRRAQILDQRREDPTAEEGSAAADV